MDRPRQTDHLGVNKTGKSIRKSPIHQSNFSANASAPARPQAQPQVYSVSKNDFRSVVQQLTGSPSRDSLPRPPPQNNNSPRPQNTRLQRVRPAPLTELNRPTMPLQHRPHSFVQQQQQQQPAESPISEYMRYLQSSLGDAGPSGNQMQPGHEHPPYMPAQPHHHPQSQPQPQPQTQQHMMSGSQQRVDMQGPLQTSQYQPPPGLVPSPMPRNLPFPQFNGPVPGTPNVPSPRFGQMYGGFPSPRYDGGFTSPRYNGFGPLPSPTSQFLQPSPTGYPNMFSPRSPYPLLSPGVQYPQPLTPNFSFSQIAQSGSHGPGAGPGPGPGPSQPPPSPGLMFPPSPSGFFPILSPRWGGY